MPPYIAQIHTAVARGMTTSLVVLGAIAGLQACTSMPSADERAMAATYQQAIASPIRTDQDRRTDTARHPAEFLPFTQVRSGMQVLDVSAGGGYTSHRSALPPGPAAAPPSA